MGAPTLQYRLLSFARDLHRAADFETLLALARREVAQAIGYDNVWLMVGDEEHPSELRLLSYAGTDPENVWEHAPVLTIRGDPMLEEIARGEDPVIVPDARTDPRTNKEIVAQIGNRTIVNIPIRIVGSPFAVFGTGSFAPSPCREPTPAELDHLVGMANQLTVAVGRIRLAEQRQQAERERLEVERRIGHFQKMESIGMLAGGIAHDFSNLLTVVMSSAAFLLDLERNDEVATEAETILRAAERGRDLTKQLLAMSRDRAFTPKPLDLNRLLEQLIVMLRRVFPATITLDFVPALRLPLVEGDATQIEQAFMNLCLNARDAMGERGHLTLETEHVVINGSFIKAHPWARPGRYALVSVTDTGCGMSAEVLTRIFEPFFTTKDEGKGTGLGLAMVYGTIRQHEGLIHAYSEVGMGSTFKVYLPVFSREASDVGDKLRGKVPGGIERVLLAEDHADVRDSAQRILTDAGYEVVAVSTGEDAIAVAARETFNLIILDVVMPGCGGPEAMRAILEADPKARVLLATGYSTDGRIVALAQTGTEILRKPYHPDELLRTVRRMLDRT